MNRFFNFQFPQTLAVNLRIIPLLLTLITLLNVGPVLGQSSEIFKCPENIYTFTGNPEQTLCEQYPNFNCEIQIGAGTPFPKSSLLSSLFLSGNICVVGDFEVDVPLTFQNAIVKINPGVTIAVKPSPNGNAPGSSLGIDNSKLFACTGLWKGITIGHLSSIGTSNGSMIEDAEKAIYASGLCALTVRNTTFNRNRIGLELDTPFPSIFNPGPLVWVFSGNKFSCDAPLNGTINEISEAGVKLKNSSLFTFQSGLNRFDDLIYGIYADGNSAQIGASHFYMRRIKKDGIYMKEGLINLSDSWFYDGELNGINIGMAKSVHVTNTQFITLSNTPIIELRTGIFIGSFALNAVVNVDDIEVSADMEGTTNKLRGIDLLGGISAAAGTKIHISNSKFWFRARDSEGIILRGYFPESTSSEIWGNSFRVSNLLGLSTDRPSGIIMTGGDKSNLSIKWNTFTSYFFNPPPPPGTFTSSQYNQGIELGGNFLGIGNEVTANSFNYDVQSLHDGLIVGSFLNTKYCSNIFKGFGLGTTGAKFDGTCTGTTFTGNIFEFSGQHALHLRLNAQIGIQSNTGNQWRNLFGAEPDFHALCQANPLFNKFIVHTQQSTCANEPDPCFNPFHPRKIEPDLMDEFFDIDPTGTPSDGCNDEFTGGGTDELDRQIAQGTFAPQSDDPAMGWVLQRYLYHKFKRNPSLTSEHTSFPAFMTGKENTTVGKFYDVHTAIENALKASANVDASSAQVLSDISVILESIADVDEAIEQQGLTATLKAQKEDLMLQIHGQHWVYDSLRTIHEAQVAGNLQTAYNLNQAITTAQAYETNEKSVNQIRLLSLMQQGGELTEGQVATLQAIAQQDPKQGGPAVHSAMGLLQECAKPETPDQYLITSQPDYREHERMIEERNAVDTFRETSELSVSPNPTYVSFLVRNPDGNLGTLTLFDVSGKAWLEQSFSGQEVRVDLKTGTPPGVYLLRFDMEDGISMFKKLIVQSN